MDTLDPASTPQFSQAEYAKPAECALCKQPFAGAYYVANSRTLCPSCGERLKREGPQDDPGRFIKALVVGSVAAVIGLALYAGFTILTGFYIGYVSLAVGFIVGKGITIGSGGVGGRKYQIAALILTYAAVSMAAIPIGLHQWSSNRKNQQAVQQKSASPASPASDATAQSPGTSDSKQAGGNNENSGKMSFGSAIARLSLVGLASPFLELTEGIGGILGLIILFVGLRIAWTITAGSALEVSGPFEQATPTASAGR